MGQFGINLKLDFGDLKLDKLFKDASVSDKANLAIEQSNISANYQTNTANSYGGSANNGVETIDFSSTIDNQSGQSNVSISNGESNNLTLNNNGHVSQGTNVDINKTNASGSDAGTSVYTQSKTNTSSTSTQVELNQQTSNMSSTNNTINTNSSSMDMNSATSNGVPNNGSNLNSNQVEISTNNVSNSSAFSQIGVNSNAYNGSTNISGQGMVSAGTSNSMGNGDNSTNVSVDMNGQFSFNSSNVVNSNVSHMDITTTAQSQSQSITEMDIEDYINNLKVCGFTETDINRIINGEISPEDLLNEIQSDASRKRYMMESSYLRSCDLEFNSMTELEAAIKNTTQKLQQLIEQKNNMDSDDGERAAIMNIITRLKNGETLENILKSEVVAWKYTDEFGNVEYRYDDPYVTGDSGGVQYELVYFPDMYGDSQMLNQLNDVLSEETIHSFFGDEQTVHRWTGSETQEAYFDEFLKEYDDINLVKKSEIAKLDEQISNLQQQKTTYEYMYNYINSEIEYYFKNIDPYISQDNFEANCNYNSENANQLSSIFDVLNYQLDANNGTYENKNYNGVFLTNNNGYQNIEVNNKEALIAILSGIINQDGMLIEENGALTTLDNNAISIISNDDLLVHYRKWVSLMSDTEKEVFNYRYNTEGFEGAYQYLDDISEELDNRWLAKKTQEDQEYAKEHPVLSSIASVVVTPMEGFSAVCYSMNSYITNEKIKRTDVYSAGDVWRGQVAQDIADYWVEIGHEKLGAGLSFAYSTGMSMADSVSLIGLSAATGGVANPVLSATMMGSRAYVSTLNDALNRGISDGAAIALAWSSAAVETAMESYSVGHLLNLETKLGESTIDLVSDIADSVSDEALASFLTKSTYVAASAISQGIAEGEEEFATEILNYVFDMGICNMSGQSEKSNYAISINNYLSLGYTGEQAFALTFKDFGQQVFQAFLGGFASGACFGTFSGVKTTYNVSKHMSQNIITDYESRGGSVKSLLEGFKTDISAMKNIDAKTFVEGLKINRLEQEMFENQRKNEENAEVSGLENINPMTVINSFKSEIEALLKTNKITVDNILNISSRLNLGLGKYEAENLMDYIQNPHADISHFLTQEFFYKLSPNEQLEVLRDRSTNFDLEKFMLGETDCDGGILFTTPDQTIMTDCFTTKYTKSGGQHGTTVEAIISTITGKNFKFTVKQGDSWPSQVINDGNICVQLCSGCDSFVWIPENITLSQYQQLVSFNEQIKQIYSKNKTHFDETPMEFSIRIGNDFNNSFSTLNNIDEVIDRLSSQVNGFSEEIVYNASQNEVKVDNTILDSVSAVSNNLQEFANLLEEIRNYTVYDLPEGYSTVDEYKRVFVRTLIDSGKINDLNNNYIFQLTLDPIMFSELVGTENLNDLYIKNLARIPKLLVPTFANLSLEDFNTLFNSPSMQKCICDMDAKSLGMVLSKFTSSFQVSWLENSTIVDRIKNMDVSGFYTFLESLGYYWDTVNNFLNSGRNDDICCSLFETISSKFFTEEILLHNLKYNDLIERIVPSSLDIAASETNTATIIDTINDTKKNVQSKINRSIIDSSVVPIIESYPSLNIKVMSESSYYNLYYELDNVEHKIEIKKDGDILDLFSIKNDLNLVQAALQGRFKITNLEVNQPKSNLVLKEVNGLQAGLNEVSLQVDGIEHNMIVNKKFDKVDLNETFPNAKSVVLESIKPLGTLNVEVEEQGALYQIKYKINDETFEGFMTTIHQPMNLKLNDNVLDIDTYVEDHNLVGIKNVEVSKVKLQEIRDKIPKIDKYNASSYIYTATKFGGDQSDVASLITDSLNGKLLSDMESNKAAILVKLVEKYFPNATDIQKVNLATHYASGGCCYMAVANAFATYMGSLENGSSIFKEKFGYDLVSTGEGSISYNMEVIAFDIYLNYFSKVANKYQVDIDSIVKSGSSGISSVTFNEIVVDYFTEHGISANSNAFSLSRAYDLNTALIAPVLSNQTGFNILVANNFDMELMDTIQNEKKSFDGALANAKKVGNIKKEVGNHAMLITDIDEDNNIIVSSWSKKYKFLSKSISEYQALGKNSYASIWTINFSIPDNNSAVSSSSNIKDADNIVYNAMDYTDSKTQLLRDNEDISTIAGYVFNVIETIDSKTQGQGLYRLEKYLMTRDISLITRANNCRNYISSLSISDLTKALNVLIAQNNRHLQFNIKNNLLPKEAYRCYNELVNILMRGNMFYNYEEYMRYVDFCKKNNLDYFKNYRYLNANIQLEQLRNQFSPKKNYVSLKTKRDIYRMFGDIGDSFSKKMVSAIKDLSSVSNITPDGIYIMNPTPISGYDLEKIKNINYLEYLFSKPSRRIVNYLDSITYNNKKINWKDRESILNYLNASSQGQFLASLTVGEVLAIYEYTLGSGTILQWLNGIPMHSNYRIKDPIVLNNIIECLDSAIQKYGGLRQNMILYRGDTLDKLSLWKGWNIKDVNDLTKYIGKTVVNDSYMSTGVSADGSFDDRTIIWKIKAPIGTQGIYINDISAYYSDDKQYEFIVRRKSEFRIDNVYEKGGKVYIEAKIVGYRDDR